MKKLKRNKNATKIAIAATLFITLTAAFANYLINKNEGIIIAKINNQNIYKEDLQTRLKDIFNSTNQEFEVPQIETLPEEVISILAKEVYVELELTKKAKKSAFTKSDEVKEKITFAKNKILRQAYIDGVLRNETSEEKITEKYQELINEIEGKKEYEISHIIVEDEKQAKKLAKILNLFPSKFARLAKKHSLDKESAANGGNLGYLLENNVIPEIAVILPALKKGSISKPIQTKFGWHIIKLNNIQDARTVSFEEAREAIKASLIKEKLEEINNDILQDFEVEIIAALKPEKSNQDDEKSDLEKSQSIPATHSEDNEENNEENQEEK